MGGNFNYRLKTPLPPCWEKLCITLWENDTLANAYDRSLMRNALTYHLGKFVGLGVCPAYKFVDLVMNGTYRGTYQISDQVEVRKKRVPKLQRSRPK